MGMGTQLTFFYFFFFFHFADVLRFWLLKWYLWPKNLEKKEENCGADKKGKPFFG